ncbi:hypothetical protein GCM10020255_036270 [Rhodococcus baikonurensis]
MTESGGAQVFADGMVAAGESDGGVGRGGRVGDLDDVFDAALGGYVDHTRFELDLVEAVGHGEEKLFGPLESRT